MEMRRETKDKRSVTFCCLSHNSQPSFYIPQHLSAVFIVLSCLYWVFVGGKVGAHTRDTKTDRETS